MNQQNCEKIRKMFLYFNIVNNIGCYFFRRKLVFSIFALWRHRFKKGSIIFWVLLVIKSWITKRFSHSPLSWFCNFNDKLCPAYGIWLALAPWFFQINSHSNYLYIFGKFIIMCQLLFPPFFTIKIKTKNQLH